MKKHLLTFFLMLCAFMGSTLSASAKGVIIYGNGEELKITHVLPDSCIIENNHVNFGVRYESFSLFFMPVWNYGEYKYALVNDAEDTWLELSVEEAKELGKEYGFEVPDEPTLPLLTQIGLKPVVAIVILFIIYGMFSKDDEEENNEENKQETQEA